MQGGYSYREDSLDRVERHLSATHRDKRREWDASKQKWNLCLTLVDYSYREWITRIGRIRWIESSPILQNVGENSENLRPASTSIKSVISYISWDLITPVIRRITFRADIIPRQSL